MVYGQFDSLTEFNLSSSSRATSGPTEVEKALNRIAELESSLAAETAAKLEYKEDSERMEENLLLKLAENEKLRSALKKMQRDESLMEPLHRFCMRGLLSKILLMVVRGKCFANRDEEKKANLCYWLSIWKACHDPAFTTKYFLALESLGLEGDDINAELLDRWIDTANLSPRQLPKTWHELYSVVDGYGAPPYLKKLCKALYSKNSTYQ